MTIHPFYHQLRASVSAVADLLCSSLLCFDLVCRDLAEAPSHGRRDDVGEGKTIIRLTLLHRISLIRSIFAS